MIVAKLLLVPGDAHGMGIVVVWRPKVPMTVTGTPSYNVLGDLGNL